MQALFLYTSMCSGPVCVFIKALTSVASLRVRIVSPFSCLLFSFSSTSYPLSPCERMHQQVIRLRCNPLFLSFSLSLCTFYCTLILCILYILLYILLYYYVLLRSTSLAVAQAFLLAIFATAFQA